MGNRMTSIRLPGSKDPGYADWGRKSADEMIAAYRAHAAHMMECAQSVLNASDANFHIETYVGPHARRNRETIQVGHSS